MRVFWIIFLCLTSFNSLSKNPENNKIKSPQIKVNNIIITNSEIKNHQDFLYKTQKYWGSKFNIITPKTAIDDIIKYEILKKHAEKIKLFINDEEV
ncbi:MAG: hypothetical protein ACKO6C_05440, partial [Alphaproteobacteria bacterium]